MQTKLIDLYKEWMETGELPDTGLCSSLPQEYEGTLELLGPTRKEKASLWKEGLSKVFWASGLSLYDFSKEKKFTPLRQTIVSLICAIHNEI